MYTWSFLDVVLAETQNGKYKNILKYYKHISIFTFPLISYALFVCYCVVAVNYFYDFYHFKLDKAETAFRKRLIIYKCLLSWNGFLILLSCMHLGLLIWQIKHMTKRINAKYLNSETQAKVRINVATTSIHILGILAIAIIFLMYAIFNFSKYYDILGRKILTSAVFTVGV